MAVMKILVLLLAAVACCSSLHVGGFNEVAGSLDCLGFISSVQRYLPTLLNPDAVNTAYVDTLRQELCMSFPQQCEDFMTKLPVAAVLLSDHFNFEDVCAVLYPVQQPDIVPTFPVNQPGDSVPCAACRMVVRVIEFDVKVMNYTTQQIVSGIKSLCAILTPLKVQKQICDDVLNYINDVIQWILSGVSPGDICTRMKLCNATTETQDASTEGINKATEITKTTTGEGGAQKVSPKRRHHHPHHVHNHTRHHNHSGHHEHHNNSHHHGHHRHHRDHRHHSDHRHRGDHRHHRHGNPEYKKSEQVEKPLIGLLNEHPFGFANMFPRRSLLGGLSQVLKHIWPSDQVYRVHEKRLPNGKDIGCRVCKRAVEFIDWEINYVNASTDQLTEWLTNLCQSVESEIGREICGTIVEKVSTIAEMVENKTASDDICRALNLCKGQQKIFLPVRRTPSRHSPCKPMCLLLGDISGFWIKREAKELTELLEDLDDLCAEIDVAEKCERAINITQRTVRDLEAMAAAEFSSNCRCVPMRFFSLRPSLGSLCDVCMNFEKALIDSLASVNESIGILVKGLHRLCDDIPEAFQEQCSLIVSEVEDIAEYFESRLNPSGVCKAIGVCDGDKQPRQQSRNVRPMSGLFGVLQSGLPGSIFQTGCQFCHGCMENLDRQLFNMGNEEAFKNSLALVCQSKSNGTDLTSVCTKMVDGVESVTRMHRKLEKSSACELLGLC